MPAPTTCTVSGILYDADGSVAGAQNYEIEVFNYEGANMVLDEKITGTTDASGVFSKTIVRGVHCVFTVPNTDFRREFDVPDAATYTLL